MRISIGQMFCLIPRINCNWLPLQNVLQQNLTNEYTPGALHQWKEQGRYGLFPVIHVLLWCYTSTLLQPCSLHIGSFQNTITNTSLYLLRPKSFISLLDQKTGWLFLVHYYQHLIYYITWSLSNRLTVPSTTCPCAPATSSLCVEVTAPTTLMNACCAFRTCKYPTFKLSTTDFSFSLVRVCLPCFARCLFFNSALCVCSQGAEE